MGGREGVWAWQGAFHAHYGNDTSIAMTYETDNDLNRITNDYVSSTDVFFDYSYNDAGQMTGKEVSNNTYVWTPGANSTQNYTTNAMNQYTAVGGNTFTYDDNGNITSDGVLDFIYDSENKLTTAKNGATTIGSYDYDPLGRRMEKTASGATTRYSYAGAEVIAEYDYNTSTQVDTLRRRNVPGIAVDMPVAFYDENLPGDPLRYFHYDGQGSVIAISDTNGAVVTTYTYSPFGQIASGNGTPFHYTGRRYDQETGLYYYRARYYSAEIGQVRGY